MKSIPLSVIVPFFNRRAFLRRAVESLLFEEIEGLEIILVDDASADDSSASVQDLPVKIIHHTQQRGAAAARNTGIRNARGEYLAFLDSDDLLVPAGLRWRLEWLRRHPETGSVCGEMGDVVDESGNILGPFHEVLKLRYDGAPPLLTYQYLKATTAIPCHFGLLMFRRKLVESIGPIDESLTTAEDLDFLLRLARHEAIPYFNRRTFHYRVHDSQISGQLTEKGFCYTPQLRADAYLVRLAHQPPN